MQYFYQPSAAELGNEPSGFTRWGGTTSVSVTVVDTGGGVYAVRFYNPSGSNVHAKAVWTDEAGPGSFADGEVYTRLRLNGSDYVHRGTLKARSDSANGTVPINSGYNLRVARISGSTVDLKRQQLAVAPNFDDALSNSPVSDGVDVDVHAVIRVQGDQISFKAWKEGDDEPESFDTVTDTVATSGYAGFLTQTTCDVYFYCLGVGTGTDSAPRAPLAASPSIVLSPDPASTTVGGAREITITRSTPAPAGAGVTYNLTSDTPAVATVPATVNMAEGQTQATFNVTGVSVGASTITATNAADEAETDSVDVTVTAVRKLRVLVEAAAAGVTGVSGVVFQAPTGGAIAGAEIGEFTGAAFEASLSGGKAELKVPVSAFGGESLTTSDVPAVLLRTATHTTGITTLDVSIIEE